MELGNLIKSQLLKIDYKSLVHSVMTNHIMPEIKKKVQSSESAWDDVSFKALEHILGYLKKDELVIEELTKDFFENYLLPNLKQLAQSSESKIDDAVVDGFKHLYELVIKPKLGIK